MKEKKTKNYEPPQVEVIEVEVEKGFAASVGSVSVNGWNSEIFSGEAIEQ